MITTSKLAREFFKEDLDAARSRGPEDYTYVVGSLLQDFYRGAFNAVVFAVIDDIKAKHAECEATGNYDRFKDPSVEVASVFLPCVAGALTIRSNDGKHLVVAWEEESDRSAVHLIPWSDPVPADLVGEAERRIEAGSSLEAMMPLAMEIARFGEQPSSEPAGIYDRVPFTIKQIREAIVDEGMKKVGRVLGHGTYEVTRHRGISIQKVVARPACELDPLLKLASLFKFREDSDDLDYRAADPMRALRDGKLEELYYSLCALVMETNVDTRLGNLETLVELGDKVGLSRTMALAYNDTDCRFHVGNYPPCDVHLHHNIDLNEGNVFATVLNRAAGEYGTVDVYLASPWGSTFESYYGRVGDGPLSMHAFQHLVKFVARGDARIHEDALHAALGNGFHPTKGKVLSYDLGSKAVDITPLAQQTGYLTYFDGMIKDDLECVAKVEAGDIADLWATEFKYRPDDGASDRSEVVTLEEHAAQRKSPPAPPPAPGA